ncbi:MAG: rhamnulokinase [Sphaerochaeta sp.]|nr:rhamnulokinase [Sphaerochaeta sp.]
MGELRCAAIDLGNTSGRVSCGAFDGKKIMLQEVARFPNPKVLIGSAVKCDVLFLFSEVLKGMKRLPDIASIAIDSWAVDFALVDVRGDICTLPHHHRDPRTRPYMQRFSSLEDQRPWYRSTGLSFQPINTSLQLLSMVENCPEALERAETLLLIADLMAYFLTGEITCDATNASTTQLLSLSDRCWDVRVIEEIGVPKKLFAPLVRPGDSLGTVTQALASRYDLNQRARVVSVGSHDTASALYAVPLVDLHHVAVVSSGTWSLFGAILENPIVSDAALLAKYNNELGVDGRTRFLKNIMGMWIIEELIRHWELEDGQRISYDELFGAARGSAAHAAVFVPDLDRFFAPVNMEDEIKHYLQDTAQSCVCDRAQLVRLVLEGLALSYRESLEQLQLITGVQYSKVCIVGGGSRVGLLNQFVADATGRDVIAGPAEATTLGNVLSQLEFHGEITTKSELVEVVCASAKIENFVARYSPEWEEAYGIYLQLKNAVRA